LSRANHNVGCIVVGLFVATWAVALGYWRIAKVEDRWTPAPATEPESA
jgi:high-affinity nickel-transport protein